MLRIVAVLCLTVFCLTTAAKPNVTIVHFPMLVADAAIYQVAINTAVDEINANTTLLPNHTLVFKMIPYAGSDEVIQKYIDSLRSVDPPVAYLGVAYAGIAERLAIVTKVDAPPVETNPCHNSYHISSLPPNTSVLAGLPKATAWLPRHQQSPLPRISGGVARASLLVPRDAG